MSFVQALIEAVQAPSAHNATVKMPLHNSLKEAGLEGPFQARYKSDGQLMTKSVKYRPSHGHSGNIDNVADTLKSHGFREGAGAIRGGMNGSGMSFSHVTMHHEDGRKVDLFYGDDGLEVTHHNP